MVPLTKHSLVATSAGINVPRMSLRFCLDEVFDLIFKHEHTSFFLFFFFSFSPHPSAYNVKQTALQGGLSQLPGPMSLCTQGNGSSRELTVTEPGKSSSGSFQFVFFFFFLPQTLTCFTLRQTAVHFKFAPKGVVQI